MPLINVVRSLVPPLLRVTCRWCLPGTATGCQGQVRLNSQRAAISRTKRAVYTRTYPTLLVQPDGSTITVRHRDPRKIIMMPVDLSSLTHVERLARLAKRKPKKKIIIEDDIEDSFDVNQYSHLWKK